MTPRLALAAVLCEVNLAVSPDVCNFHTGRNYSDFAGVYSCSSPQGGSTVTEFEVWGGCSLIRGTGTNQNPIIQTPSAINLATSSVGDYCYCQLKSINKISLPSSPKWLYRFAYSSISGLCEDNCPDDCAANALYIPAFRSALFQALQ